jgi:hypothetical protein
MNAIKRRIARGCESKSGENIGGAEGDRTLDLRIANAARKSRQVAKRTSKTSDRIDLSRSVPFAASLEFWRF